MMAPNPMEDMVPLMLWKVGFEKGGDARDSR